MRGNIYTREKCFLCDGPLIHDEKRQGCYCPEHQKVAATGQFYVKFGREINRRKSSYQQAYRFLIGLRYEVDGGKFDERDYAAGNPLGFAGLTKSYLAWKKRQGLKSYYHIEQYLTRATEYFGGMNVKYIKKKQLGEYLYSIEGISEKTRANHATYLRDFFYNYLHEEEEILGLSDLPKMPDIPYELGFRKITDLDTREKIVDRIKELTYHRNEKTWLAIDVLCSYNELRPGDLSRLREGDIDLEYGVITFWRPTKSKMKKTPKVIRIRLLDYHIEEFRTLKAKYPATDHTLFFRHPRCAGGGCIPINNPFGTNYLSKVWRKACADLGIVGLDLYGGTRHSGVTAVAMEMGKDMARKFSGHHTNKAFDRYCQIGDDDTFDVAKHMAKMRGKVVELKRTTTAPPKK